MPDERARVVDMMARKADRVLEAAPRDQPALLERIRRAQALPVARETNQPPITRRPAGVR